MSFDKSKLPELDNYSWYDIMGIAANKNYNKFISEDMECFKSGRLKRGYSAESIIQLLSGKMIIQNHIMPFLMLWTN